MMKNIFVIETECCDEAEDYCDCTYNNKLLLEVEIPEDDNDAVASIVISLKNDCATIYLTQEELNRLIHELKLVAQRSDKQTDECSNV